MNIKTMKLAAILLFAACVFLFNCDGDNLTNPGDNVSNTNYIAEEEFDFTVDVADQSILRLEGVNGLISITGESTSGSVVITGIRRVGSESTQDAQEHLELLEVDVEEFTDEIRVRTIQPEQSYGRNYEVYYDISIPEDFEIIVSNVNGSIDVNSIDNNVVVSNVNGQISLDGIFGNTVASLVNGGIVGNVVLPLNGVIAFSTVNGTVVMNIPENTSAEFEATKVVGIIQINNLNLQDEVITNNSHRGTLGGGDGEISLSTVNGSIIANGY